jgi:NTE family protein
MLAIWCARIPTGRKEPWALGYSHRADLGTATSTDFTAAIKAPSLPRRGGGARRGGSAGGLRVSDAAYGKYLAQRAAREPGLPPIQFVRVDKESKRYEKTIMAEMQPLVGKPLDPDEVGKRITELYGLGNFETLDYTLAEQPPGAGAAAVAAGLPR